MSADPRAWLRRLGLLQFLLWWAMAAAAHPMPESLVWIDATPSGMNLTAQLPLNRLEFSFGKNLTDNPGTVLYRYGDALSAYLLTHVGARSNGKGWQVLRPRLKIVGTPGFEELQATFVMRAPEHADARAPELLYDVITHEVRTHCVQIFLRNDWYNGFVGQAPLLVGELSHGHNRLYIPLGPESSGSSVASLFADGLSHIAEGTDHLLFLLLLLLVAPLSVRAGSWRAVRPLNATLKHTTFLITAFTAGHTVTLILGSTGLVAAPQQAVEVAVALTILAAAVHAWRPLFARLDTWMSTCFGLIHGMAFSSSLSGAGLTPWQHAQALFAFNLGIEAMQLVVLALVLPPLLVLGAAKRAWFAILRRALAACGALMACAWVAQRTELVAPGAQAWPGDGGLIPLLLVCLFWLGALLAMAASGMRARAPGNGRTG